MPKQRTTHPSVHTPSAEEAQEFRRAVRDVKPLAHAAAKTGAAISSRATTPPSTVGPSITTSSTGGPSTTASSSTGAAISSRARIPPSTGGSSVPGPRRRSPPARRRTPSPSAPDLDESMPLIVPTAAELGDVPVDGALGGATLSFQRAGARTQVVRRLRRGLIPIEDELDLHGLTQSAARDRLAEFLQNTRAEGRRCVRIIHGKGYRSGARGPVLKIAVDSWLRRHLDVMAFTSARAIDGGTGAVYVLLRA